MDNSSSQKQGQASQSTTHSLDTRALKAYDEYARNLSSLELYTSKFNFSHHDAYGLSEDEFHELMDMYKVDRSMRYGSKAKTVFVMREEKGRIKKSLLIFVRTKEKLYDVLVANVTMESGLDKVKLGCAALCSLIVAGGLCLLNPFAGLVAGAVCTAITGGKVAFDKKHYILKDVSIGYMIRQLVDAKNLSMNDRGELVFSHNGQETVLDNKPSPVNDSTGENNSEA